jgi:hypothetical protein
VELSVLRLTGTTTDPPIVTIDLFDYAATDIVCDLSNLPFRDESDPVHVSVLCIPHDYQRLTHVSTANLLPGFDDIIAEMQPSMMSEPQGRLIDHDESAIRPFRRDRRQSLSSDAMQEAFHQGYGCFPE